MTEFFGHFPATFPCFHHHRHLLLLIVTAVMTFIYLEFFFLQWWRKKIAPTSTTSPTCGILSSQKRRVGSDASDLWHISLLMLLGNPFWSRLITLLPSPPQKKRDENVRKKKSHFEPPPSFLPIPYLHRPSSVLKQAWPGGRRKGKKFPFKRQKCTFFLSRCNVMGREKMVGNRRRKEGKKEKEIVRLGRDWLTKKILETKFKEKKEGEDVRKFRTNQNLLFFFLSFFHLTLSSSVMLLGPSLLSFLLPPCQKSNNSNC